MRTVLHELAVLSRQPAVAVAVMVVAVLLVAFVLAWPYGVPMAPDLNAYEQTRALASLLLSVALPWASMRADAKTSSIAGARVFAHALTLALVVLTAYPPLLMAALAAAVPMMTTVVDALALTGIAVLAAGLAAACRLVVPSRLAAWVLATLVSVLVLLLTGRVAPHPVSAGATSGLVGVGVTLAAAAWGRSSLLAIRSGDA
jgi:hypothetical protein